MEYGNATFQGVLGAVVNSEVEMSLSAWMHTRERFDYMSFTFGYCREHVWSSQYETQSKPSQTFREQWLSISFKLPLTSLFFYGFFKWKILFFNWIYRPFAYKSWKILCLVLLTIFLLLLFLRSFRKITRIGGTLSLHVHDDKWFSFKLAILSGIISQIT